MRRKARAKDVINADESPGKVAGRMGGGKLHRRCSSKAFFSAFSVKVGDVELH